MIQCNFSVAHAFRPPSLSEELGCSPTLTILMQGIENYQKDKLVYFDPLGIASDTNFPRLREAELKHGRIAMLAMTERILLPFSPLAWNMDPTNNGRSLYYGDMLSRIRALSLSDFLKVVVTCGVLEIFIFTQKDPKDMPGDYGTGYFGRRDKGRNEWKLRIELENGRLAMLALLTQFVLEVATGGLTWDQQWGLFTDISEANLYVTDL
ncbi:hypothetical protein FisN_3Hh352 [Fistulifera solaris]|uniref:Light-harvesting complex I chlorophyll a/b binding protein 4 n=1 Tax=Fistulifera solaris TaxID=1519565 RepID=A0A1Z5JQ70_FISSO|nr:hypothetical protein FisN_3Hh352 [Fistulifera solaris]|eukprot:GAX16167.1 hypothetical protein FisN_3Hh352 [Fistulifera solaris]